MGEGSGLTSRVLYHHNGSRADTDDTHVDTLCGSHLMRTLASGAAMEQISETRDSKAGFRATVMKGSTVNGWQSDRILRELGKDEVPVASFSGP